MARRLKAYLLVSQKPVDVLRLIQEGLTVVEQWVTPTEKSSVILAERRPRRAQGVVWKEAQSLDDRVFEALRMALLIRNISKLNLGPVEKYVGETSRHSTLIQILLQKGVNSVSVSIRVASSNPAKARDVARRLAADTGGKVAYGSVPRILSCMRGRKICWGLDLLPLRGASVYVVPSSEERPIKIIPYNQVKAALWKFYDSSKLRKIIDRFVREAIRESEL